MKKRTRVISNENTTEETINAETSTNSATPEESDNQIQEVDIDILRRRYFKFRVPTHLEKDQLKIWVMNRLVENIALFKSGTEVTMPELFGPPWSMLSTGTKRQASKEFKIAVAQTVIHGIFFLKTKSGKLKRRNASLS